MREEYERVRDGLRKEEPRGRERDGLQGGRRQCGGVRGVGVAGCVEVGLRPRGAERRVCVFAPVRVRAGGRVV